MKKRLLALLLCLCMAASFLSTAALADETGGEGEGGTETGTTPPEGSVASVTIGDNVSYHNMIEAAWEAATEGSTAATVTLLKDAETSKTLNVGAGKIVKFTGEAGVTLTASDSVEWNIIDVNGGELNITGASIAAGNADGSSRIVTAIMVENGSKFNMSGGTITADGSIDSANLSDGSAAGGTGGIAVCGGSTATISGGKITVSGDDTSGVNVYVNKGDVHTTLTISDEAEIVVNGKNSYGVNCNANNYESGAVVNINGGSIKATGSNGDGIWVRNGGEIKLSGGTFSGTSSAIRIPQTGSLSDLLLVEEGQTYAYFRNGIQIPSTELTGRTLTGTISVKKTDGAASSTSAASVKIGDNTTNYDTFEAAWAAANDGSVTEATITLLRDAEWENNAGLILSAGNGHRPTINFVGGNHTLTQIAQTDSDRSPLGIVVGAGTLNIESGTIVTPDTAIRVSGGTVNIHGGTLESPDTVIQSSRGVVDIKGGTLVSSGTVIRHSGGILTINGGTVKGLGTDFAIDCYGEGKMFMYSGTVCSKGPGFAMTGNTEVYVHGGSIYSTEYVQHSAAVDVQGGKLTVIGGNIGNENSDYGLFVNVVSWKENNGPWKFEAGSAEIRGGSIKGREFGLVVHDRNEVTVSGEAHIEATKGNGIYYEACNTIASVPVPLEKKKLTIRGGTIKGVWGLDIVSGDAPVLQGGTFEGGVLIRDEADVTYTVENLLKPGYSYFDGNDNKITDLTGRRLPGTVTVKEKSTSDSGSGSGGGSSNTTTTSPDGSSTTTTTNSTGGTTSTTTRPDGTQIVVDRDRDGAVTATNKTPDGSTGVVTKSPSGKVEANVTLSTEAVEQANGQPVALPMASVRATNDNQTAPVVTVNTGSTQPVNVEIPATGVTSGTVAVLVKADGTEEVIKTSIPTEKGVAVALPDGATVKIVENSKSFSDISNDSWEAEAVNFSTARELLKGTSENSFSPEATMTRAMLVTVLARFDGQDTDGGSTWYENGVNWAVANGISDGIDPNGNISREEIAVMLWRYSGSPSANSSLADFADADSISDYAEQALRWAVENGIVNGTGDGRVNPQGEATRAEVAQMLKNFIVK